MTESYTILSEQRELSICGCNRSIATICRSPSQYLVSKVIKAYNGCMLFPKGNFTVGINEKHNISFATDLWWGKFDVFIDGKPSLIQGKSMLSGPFTIEIGSEEKHTISFQFIIPAVFPVFKDKQLQVLVDGKLLQTF